MSLPLHAGEMVRSLPQPASPVVPQPPQTVLNDDDLLLCLLRLGYSTLASDLATYMTPKGLFLPLGELSRLLELGITVDAAKGSGSGFVATASAPFLLDISSGSVIVSGRARRYDPALVSLLPDDIYVERGLLAEWLSMRIDANRFDAVVDIRPFEPIPLQQRIARSARGSNSWGYGSYNDPGYPLREAPYQLLAGPSIDLSLASSLTGDKENRVNLGGSRYYTRISGDILLMSGQFDLSGQIATPGKSFFSLENGGLILQRENPAGGLLGPLGARTVAIGDIQRSSLPLIGNSGGPGVMISSYPLTHSPLFDKLTLRGFLAQGWDVELYRNGSLLDYRPSNTAESYSFTDVPLVYGLNELRLVFHGPQGRQRVENHIYNVGSNMFEPGKWSYEATVADASRSSLLGPRPLESSPLMTWKSTVGINNWLTASNYLATTLVGTGRRNYAGGGFSGYFRMMQLDLQVVGNVAANQWARQIGVQTGFNPLTITFLMQGYDRDWQSISGQATYLRKWDTRITGIHPFPLFSSSRLALDLSKTEYTDQRSSTAVQLTSSNRTLGLEHTHSLIFARGRDAFAASDSITGISYLNLIRNLSSLRAQFDYTLFPRKTVNAVAVGGELKLSHGWISASTISYSILSKFLTVSTGLSRTAGDVALGLTGNYLGGGAWNVGFQLSTNLSRAPRSGHWSSNGSLNCQQAAVSAQAYLDSNRNRVWDPGEPPLEGVSFQVNQQSRQPATDGHGVAFLQGLAPYVPTDITLSAYTLKDLLWVPADKGLRVVPRPGYAVPAVFPVWITGEVTGTVYRMRDEIRSSASGIIIEAVAEAGVVLARSRSEYDGVYTFTALPVGKYAIRVSPDQAGKLKTTAPLREVVIPPEGSCIDGIDLVLEEQLNRSG